MIHPHHFLIMGLAVWRFSNMLVYDEGPGDVFGWIRRHMIRENDKPGSLSQGMQCPYCVSVWLSMVVFLGYAIWPFITLYVCIPLALAGFSSIIQQFTYDRSLSVSDSRPPAGPPESLDD
jgi:hypothetical protein